MVIAVCLKTTNESELSARTRDLQVQNWSFPVISASLLRNVAPSAWVTGTDTKWRGYGCDGFEIHNVHLAERCIPSLTRQIVTFVELGASLTVCLTCSYSYVTWEPVLAHSSSKVDLWISIKTHKVVHRHGLQVPNAEIMRKMVKMNTMLINPLNIPGSALINLYIYTSTNRPM